MRKKVKFGLLDRVLISSILVVFVVIIAYIYIVLNPPLWFRDLMAESTIEGIYRISKYENSFGKVNYHLEERIGCGYQCSVYCTIKKFNNIDSAKVERERLIKNRIESYKLTMRKVD